LCDDLASPWQCGATAVADGCGGTVDCGDCGANGTCDGGTHTCTCDADFFVADGEHECIHVCDGYLPDEGCCDGAVLFFCNSSSEVEYFDCFENYGGFGPPWDSCGWMASLTEFTCGGVDDPSPLTADCPDGIVENYGDTDSDTVDTDTVDTDSDSDTTPACDNDSWDDAASNETDATATLLAAGTYPGLVLCSGEADWYRIATTASFGQTITVTITFINADGDIDLYFWWDHFDMMASTFLDFSDSHTSNTETVSWVAGDPTPYGGLVTGTDGYLIQVLDAYAAGVVGNSYSMTIAIE